MNGKMNHKTWLVILSVALASGVTSAALAAAAGQPAPDFSLTDAHGKTTSLADYRGKYVVLEWTNPECPFVRRQYNSKNMQDLQAEWSKKGVAWLSIDSSNRSSGDYKTPAELERWLSAHGASPTDAFVDADSTAARLYAAKTTPHMFVIDPQGKIVYAGAIDDRPSAGSDDPHNANNYVRAALTSTMSGRAVATANTTPYGCSIKY